MTKKLKYYTIKKTSLFKYNIMIIPREFENYCLRTVNF